MLSSIIFTVILICSFVGWTLFTHRKLRIHPAFIPIFVLSSMTSVMFVAGMLDVMPVLVYVIGYGGLLLCGYEVYLLISKKVAITPLFTASTLWFVGLCVLLAIALHGVMYLNTNNFTHWGLIVKEIYTYNQLPHSPSLIDYQNYPPGSAVFIYYFLKLTGYSESKALLAQGYLIIASVVTILAFATWRNYSQLIISASVIIVMVTLIGASLYDLMVDHVLGVTALCMVLIAYYYRLDIRKSLLVNLPIVILLVLLKDSGILLVLLDFLLVLGIFYASYWKEKRTKPFRRKYLAYVLIVFICIPIATQFSWVNHVKVAFPNHNYEDNKFVMSPNHMFDNPKSEITIQLIKQNFLTSAMDLKSDGLLSLVILCVVAIILMVWIYLRKRKLSLVLMYAILFTSLSYAIYMYLLRSMYLLLMSAGEDKNLTSFSRFQTTILIVCVGVMMVAIMIEFAKHHNRLKPIWKYVLTIGLVIVFIFPHMQNIRAVAAKPVFEHTMRASVLNNIQKINYGNNPDPYIVYYYPASKNSTFFEILIRFEQLNTNFAIITSCTQSNRSLTIEQLIKRADYIYVMTVDDDFKQCILPLIGDKNRKGMFKI